MLVLSRTRSEKCIITHKGETLEIMVVEIKGGHKVRIGFEGPESFQIDRQEVYEAKQRERAREKRAVS